VATTFKEVDRATEGALPARLPALSAAPAVMCPPLICPQLHPPLAAAGVVHTQRLVCHLCRQAQPNSQHRQRQHRLPAVCWVVGSKPGGSRPCAVHRRQQPCRKEAGEEACRGHHSLPGQTQHAVVTAAGGRAVAKVGGGNGGSDGGRASVRAPPRWMAECIQPGRAAMQGIQCWIGAPLESR
jgi:hypothetical protein